MEFLGIVWLKSSTHVVSSGFVYASINLRALFSKAEKRERARDRISLLVNVSLRREISWR